MIAEPAKIQLIGHSARLVHRRPGLNSTAEADDQGRITLNVTGPSPKNEEDALEICARLVRMLNEHGETWSDPVRGEQDIDGYSENLTGDKLRMQVVRAINDTEFWRQLNEDGSATIEFTALTVANELMNTIRKKASKYPAAQRNSLTLVLDASRTPSHTFQRVIDVFHQQHLPDCKAAGFAQIWVVGPQDGIVQRLDQL
jgi:hypothetical protein